MLIPLHQILNIRAWNRTFLAGWTVEDQLVCSVLTRTDGVGVDKHLEQSNSSYS